MIEVRHLSGTGARSKHAIYRGSELVGMIARFSHLTGWEISSAFHGVTLHGHIPSLAGAREIAQRLTYPTRAEVLERLTKDTARRRRALACAAEGPELARLLREVLDLAGDTVNLPIRSEAEGILHNIAKFTNDRTRYHFKDNPTPWTKYEQARAHLPPASDLNYPNPD